MNKNILIYSFSLATFTTVWLCTLISPHTGIAESAPAQLSNHDLMLREKSEIAINLSNKKLNSNLNKVIVFLGLVGLGALFWTISQPRKGRKSNFQTIKAKSNTALLDRVNPKLRRQLLRLINDPKTVNRLLMGIYQNNRDRSPNWIAEKAIYDLRRGR